MRRGESPQEKLIETLDELSSSIRNLKDEISSLHKVTSDLSYNVYQLLGEDSNLSYLYQSIDELTEAIKQMKTKK